MLASKFVHTDLADDLWYETQTKWRVVIALKQESVLLLGWQERGLETMAANTWTFNVKEVDECVSSTVYLTGSQLSFCSFFKTVHEKFEKILFERIILLNMFNFMHDQFA